MKDNCWQAGFADALGVAYRVVLSFPLGKRDRRPRLNLGSWRDRLPCCLEHAADKFDHAVLHCSALDKLSVDAKSGEGNHGDFLRFPSVRRFAVYECRRCWE